MIQGMDKRELVKVCRPIYSAPANVNTEDEDEDHRIFVLFIAPPAFVVMTGPQLQDLCRRVAYRDTRMVYEQDITHEELFFYFECKSAKVDWVFLLDTDSLEDTIERKSQYLSTFRELNTYLNPLPPVAINVPGICACQCTSFTDSI